MLRNKANAAFGLIVAAAAAVLLYATTGFEGEKDDRLFPQIILVILLVLGTLLVVTELRLFNAAKAAAAGRFTARNALAFVLAIGYPLAAFALGFFATTFLFLLIVPWLFARDEKVSGRDGRVSIEIGVSALYALLVTSFLYLSFDVFLKFSLPSGLLM